MPATVNSSVQSCPDMRSCILGLLALVVLSSCLSRTPSESGHYQAVVGPVYVDGLFHIQQHNSTAPCPLIALSLSTNRLLRAPDPDICGTVIFPLLSPGVTWKAQNQAAVLLAAGQKGHRYTFPHAKISTSPPIMNRVFGQAVDAQLQANELEYATKYYAAILARSTGKDLATCQKEYLSRWVIEGHLSGLAAEGLCVVFFSISSSGYHFQPFVPAAVAQPLPAVADLAGLETGCRADILMSPQGLGCRSV